MTLEMALQQQIDRNAVILGEKPVYHIIDTDTAAAEFMGMTESEFEEFLAGVVCRNWDDEEEITGE